MTFLVLGILLALQELPALSVAGISLRKVDMWSDIRVLDVPEEMDTVLLPALPKPAFVDTCPQGMVCIEDYSDSTQRGMQPFYEALDRLGTGQQWVRIAVFGDSFIEADIFTGDLREMLQQKYGGCGVGFVPITSDAPGFRPTVQHFFYGWESHAPTDSMYYDRKRQGLSGHYFIPSRGATVELRGQSRYASRLDTFERAAIVFETQDHVELTAHINRENLHSNKFSSSPRLQQMEVEGKIGSVKWIIQSADSATFYGMFADGRQGIILDNFSLRGASGITLSGIPSRMLREFNHIRPYDLIILQYGLNVATERRNNYEGYQKGMLQTIALLKEYFPQAGILLMGVGDRNYRTDTGELRTMPGVKNLIRYQRNMAAGSQVAFWDMFEAMGGDGSMARLVHASPSMANYDYTHINFRGGRHLAELFFKTLIHGKEQTDRQKAHEEE